MTQRRINTMAFGFLGVILGILLAVVAGYDTIGEVMLAIIVSGGFGALIGSQWTPAQDQRRARHTSR